MGKFILAIWSFTLMFIFSSGLVGCSETPKKSSRKQVMDAEKASGFNSDPLAIEIIMR
ncbi:hypothetical protein [Yokenella regensburgei]|uniref:hypothetical protein n=1 Tax=Yokenella regensburgei TaxID=158877 RepID=UPI003EDAC0BE